MSKNYVDRGGLDISKEVLWASAGQRTAKLKAVKVGDRKKSCGSTGVEPNKRGPGLSPGQLDYPQILTEHNFAAL